MTATQLHPTPAQTSPDQLPSTPTASVADAQLADTQQQAPGSFKFVIVTALASCVSLTVAGLLALAVIAELQPLVAADQSLAPFFFHLTQDNPFIATLAGIWHLLGTSNVATPIVITVLVVLLLARRPGYAGYLVACSLGGLIISETFKDLVGRGRPEWADPFFVEAGNSFPSGHSLSGICTWAVLGIICIRVVDGRRGHIFGWALIVFGLLMAPSRLFFGVHWTTDVLAGWAFGLGWTLLVTAVFVAIQLRRQSDSIQSLTDEARSEIGSDGQRGSRSE